jgi:hypothetical protein
MVEQPVVIAILSTFPRPPALNVTTATTLVTGEAVIKKSHRLYIDYQGIYLLVT